MYNNKKNGQNSVATSAIEIEELVMIDVIIKDIVKGEISGKMFTRERKANEMVESTIKDFENKGYIVENSKSGKYYVCTTDGEDIYEVNVIKEA